MLKQLFSSRPGLQRTLDVVSSMLVMTAALAVIATSAKFWQVVRQVPPPSTQAAVNLPKSPQALDDTPTVGDTNAKVAIIEYSDFQCPFCGRFVQETWPELKKRYVDPGDVVFAFRHLPLANHQFAKAAAIRADCARAQGRFWEMHDLLFARQEELEASTGDSIARTLGFEQTAFARCLQQRPTRVDRDIESAHALSVNSTPTFLIGAMESGRRVRVMRVVVGAQPVNEFVEAIDGVMRESQRTLWQRLLGLVNFDTQVRSLS